MLSTIKKLKKLKIFQWIFKIIFSIVGQLPKKQHVMIYESFHGKQYSDSPRAIYEYMMKHHPEYKMYWTIDKRSIPLFEQYNVPYIQRFTPKWFLTMPRAKYWINNVRLPKWMPKSKGTIYVQTWHGTPLKKLGVDIEEVHMPGTDTEAYRKNFLEESANWDFLVSPNEYSTDIFKRAFEVKGEVIESGYPRNDILYNADDDKVKTIKEHLQIPVDKKIILYAPTWRDDNFHAKGQYKFEFQFDLHSFRERFGEDAILLTRMHYLVAEHFDFAKYEGLVKDVSTYPDIAELYLISDMLITDYSSVFFDYANLKRPIIFYMYDLEDYRDRLRGFYFDIEKEAPGPIVKTEADLFESIESALEEGYQLPASYMPFYKRFCSLEDGEASKRVVERIGITNNG